MRKFFVVILLQMAFATLALAQEREVSIAAEWGSISATLALPDEGVTTAALIVAGSGPTDRNGNSSLQLNTYAYKMLSDELVEGGFAVLRYDKRGLPLSAAPTELMLNVVFSDYVDDAALCVDYLRDMGYDRVVVVGHSEGGQIALELALRSELGVDGVVLLSAAGYPMETILMRQLSAQLMPSYVGLMVAATDIIQRLKRGENIAEESIPKELLSLFHPAVQPFVRSNLTTDPQELISRVEQPALIISGGRDIQVSVDNAERLVERAKRGKHISFENMCHTLKDTATSDRIEQLMSVYINSQLPLSDGLAAAVVEFMKQFNY